MIAEQYVGNTPLVEIQHLTKPGTARVFVKLEEYNFGGSIKSRVALQMIQDAESAGVLHPGSRIIEATGGNTGIGLAIIGSLHKYQVTLVIPDNFSQVKIKTCKALGAEVILSDSTLGSASHIHKTSEILLSNPDYVNLNQFVNSSNARSHYLYTGVEILNSLERVDVFVAAAGSGGTLSGIGRCLKEKMSRRTKIIAVQPWGCDVLNGKIIPHIVEGTTLGFVPQSFETSIVDGVEEVNREEVLELFRTLPRLEGLFVGLSSAANICAAVKIASKLPRSCIVATVAPDGGRNYPDYI